MSDDPVGFVAVDADRLCGGCAFWKKGCRNDEARCCPSQRKDGRTVIFVPAEKRAEEDS